MRALRKHTDCIWILLYTQRWLEAPVQLPDGSLKAREKGTPQGAVISPLKANLFLHYAFDLWMQRRCSTVRFERFADDVIFLCISKTQAQWLLDATIKRMAECKLELNNEKTKIVYCKDANRPGSYPNEKFDFLGFTFRPRLSKNRNGTFYARFSPAVSRDVNNSIRQTMRS